MRNDYRLMSTLALETRLEPKKRIEKLLQLNQNLRHIPSITRELSDWNLQLDEELLEVDGRLLNAESIIFDLTNSQSCRPDKGDWTRFLRRSKSMIANPLTNWSLLVTESLYAEAKASTRIRTKTKREFLAPRESDRS